MPLFNRISTAIITTAGGENINVEGLRMEFEIHKTITRTANTCILKIYNLSETTRNKISVVNNVLSLAVGYSEDSGSGVIFVGDITFAKTTFPKPEVVTTIEASDGKKVLRESRISLSFKGETKVSDVLTQIADSLEDIALRPTGDLGSLTLKKGFSFTGPIEEALDKVTAALRLEWSIQNNELQIIEQGKVNQEEIVVISPMSGLINSPERQDDQGVTTDGNKKPPGWKFKSLLQTRVEPGGLVQLESREANGQFRVEDVKHFGDTHGENWNTEASVVEEAA